MKVHLRLDGESRTLDAAAMRINPQDDEARILEQLARALDMPAVKLHGAVVDRNPDGIVIRPPAIYG